MVVVDKLMKDAHFIPLKTTHKAYNVVDIYMREVAHFHGIPRQLCLTETQNLPQSFGEDYSKGSERT
jgi:hypothetical protein